MSTSAQRTRQVRRERRDSGLCHQCGARPPAAGPAVCGPCLDVNRQRAKAQRETSILVGTRPSGGGRPEPKGVTIVAQKRRRFQNSRCSERPNAAAIRLSSRTNCCCRYSLRMYWVHNCAGTARRPAHRGCALRK